MRGSSRRAASTLPHPHVIDPVFHRKNCLHLLAQQPERRPRAATGRNLRPNLQLAVFEGKSPKRDDTRRSVLGAGPRFAPRGDDKVGVGTRFETWACSHVAFEEIDDVWPYFLEDGFGGACLKVMSADAFASFDDSDCLRVALELQLPIKADGSLPLPISVSAPNPVSESAFSEFRIQTVRDQLSASIIRHPAAGAARGG